MANIFILIFLILMATQTNGDGGCVTDTIFLLDSSGSIRKSFDQYRQYVHGLLQQMPISPGGHHASLIVYSGRLRQFTKWALDQGPQEKGKLLERVDALPHLNGVTATGVALDVVTQRELPKRRKSPRTRTNLVVLTDGFSYDPVDVQSANLHSIPDVRTFSVCLDEIRVHSELVTIAGNEENVFIGKESKNKLLPKLLDCPASSPSEYGGNDKNNGTQNGQQEVEPAADVPAGEGESKEGGGKTEMPGNGEETYGNGGNESEGEISKGQEMENGQMDSKNASNSAEQGKGEGAEKTLNNGNEGNGNENANKSTGTREKAIPKFCPTDFIFVLDGSGSLRQRFEHQKEMAAELVEALPQGDGIRIGLVKYSGKGKSRVKLPIENRLSRQAIQKLIRGQLFFGGTTFTNEALEKAMGELGKNGVQKDGNSAKNGKHRQQIVAVFTDGMSQEDPTSGAKALHGKGAIVYSIAVEDGHPIHLKELELIAGDQSRVFTDKNFEQLMEKMKAFPKNC